MEPLVSIIMPNYNGYPFIKEAIESILKQSYKNWELILIDDASQDESLEYCKQIAQRDERIHLILHDKNRGVTYSRNEGLELSHGKYIAFLDSDDIWNSNKLKGQIKFMEEENLEFTSSPYNVMNESGKLLYSLKISKYKLDLGDILKHCDIGILTAIYKKEIFSDLKFLNTERAEDYTLWILMLKRIPYLYIYPEFTASYRIRAGSRASNKWKVGIAIWKIYKDVAELNFLLRLYYISHYILFFIRKKTINLIS